MVRDTAITNTKFATTAAVAVVVGWDGEVVWFWRSISHVWRIIYVSGEERSTCMSVTSYVQGFECTVFKKPLTSAARMVPAYLIYDYMTFISRQNAMQAERDIVLPM